MTTLALVRHGQTDWNLQKRIQGRTDIPLNATGRAQAAETAQALTHGTGWDAVITSPLGRARETAQIIASALALPEPFAVDGLAERRYGEAEGLDFEELHRRFPGTSHVPGRETHTEVRTRVHEALIDVARGHPGERIIVVCHGGVISSLVRYATGGIRPRVDERIANGSVHYFSYIGGELRLDLFNDEPMNELMIEAGSEAPRLTQPS